MVAAAYDVKRWVAKGVVSRAAEKNEPWNDLDRQLRSVASRRAALDHEELTLLREAVRVQLWRAVGMTSMREYLEHAMGYGPQVAAERLRVAEALDALPAIEDALATGALPYSAVRELTRIATCKTEQAWVDACRGKNLRQIEELVAEREPGDGPKDRPKPDLRPHAVKLTLRPAARATLQQVRHAIANERGEPIDDSELIDALCRRYLAGSADGGGDGDAPLGSRPPVQIAITRCDACKQARQHAAGRTIAISDAEYETAACDALMIGSLDGTPTRASSTIPPATKRQVRQRDHFKCAVPWCRAAANIDVHHILYRSNGGGHEPDNLVSLCSGHHGAQHRGELLIEGRAPEVTFRRKYEVPHVGDHNDQPRAALPHVGELGDAHDVPVPHVGDVDGDEVPHVGEPEARIRVAVPHVGDPGARADVAAHDPQDLREALLALTTLGFRKPEAERALGVARCDAPPDSSLESLVRGALRELRKTFL